MALANLRIFSEALGMQTSVLVVLPQTSTKGEIGITGTKAEGKLKCLYLLHGLSDDYTVWMRRTSIERYATRYGIAVVMPDGARSFYTDMKYGGKYHTYITSELPSVLESMLNISPKREDRYIGGLSMGGYGAMKTALREVGRYAAAFALSPVSDIHNRRFDDTLVAVFGEDIPSEADLFYLAEKHNADAVKPRIYMTVGKDDFMYSDTVRLNACFEALDYDYKYVETEGDHSWDLWDITVQSALEWMLGSET